MKSRTMGIRARVWKNEISLSLALSFRQMDLQLREISELVTMSKFIFRKVQMI